MCVCLTRRCVVVLGLPYPNPSDPELRERMRFLDEAAAVAAAPAAAVAAPASTAAAAPAAGVAGTTAGPAAALAAAPAPPCAPAAAAPRLTGRQYYSGLCIKAVNQCVGRCGRPGKDVGCPHDSGGQANLGSAARGELATSAASAAAATRRTCGTMRCSHEEPTHARVPPPIFPTNSCRPLSPPTPPPSPSPSPSPYPLQGHPART